MRELMHPPFRSIWRETREESSPRFQMLADA